MKFEGNYPDAPKEAPTWFHSFYKNYGLVVKFLNSAGKRGLNLGDNILNSSINRAVVHSQPVQFQHNLGVTPVCFMPQGGRYSCFVINSSDKNATTVTFYLLSSPCTSMESYATIDFVDVLDAAIFKLNDQIIIGNQIRKITNINTNRITLDSAIRLTLPVVVTLYTESMNAVFL